MAAVLAAPKPALLTDSVRAYLAAARDARYLFTQVNADLTQRFNLTPSQAGVMLAEDLKEQI